MDGFVRVRHPQREQAEPRVRLLAPASIAEARHALERRPRARRRRVGGSGSSRIAPRGPGGSGLRTFRQQASRFLLRFHERAHGSVELALVDGTHDAADLGPGAHAQLQHMASQEKRVGRPLRDFEGMDPLQEPLHGHGREVTRSSQAIGAATR